MSSASRTSSRLSFASASAITGSATMTLATRSRFWRSDTAAKFTAKPANAGAPASRQEAAKRAATLRRRKGAHRHFPARRHLPIRTQPVLHPRRSRRPPRRSQRRPLHRPHQGDEHQDAVRSHHPQQEDHERRPGTLRRDYAGARRFEAGFGSVWGDGVTLTCADANADLRSIELEAIPMANLDWSQCPAVESIPGKVSGAWVLKGTRMPVSVIFENLEAGMSIREITE